MEVGRVPPGQFLQHLNAHRKTALVLVGGGLKNGWAAFVDLGGLENSARLIFCWTKIYFFPHQNLDKFQYLFASNLSGRTCIFINHIFDLKIPHQFLPFFRICSKYNTAIPPPTISSHFTAPSFGKKNIFVKDPTFSHPKHFLSRPLAPYPGPDGWVAGMAR